MDQQILQLVCEQRDCTVTSVQLVCQINGLIVEQVYCQIYYGAPSKPEVKNRRRKQRTETGNPREIIVLCLREVHIEGTKAGESDFLCAVSVEAFGKVDEPNEENRFIPLDNDVLQQAMNYITPLALSYSHQHVLRNDVHSNLVTIMDIDTEMALYDVIRKYNKLGILPGVDTNESIKDFTELATAWRRRTSGHFHSLSSWGECSTRSPPKQGAA